MSLSVEQHLSWVTVLEKAAEAFCLAPEQLAEVRSKGIPEMLQWAEEHGVKLTFSDSGT